MRRPTRSPTRLNRPGCVRLTSRRSRSGSPPHIRVHWSMSVPSLSVRRRQGLAGVARGSAPGREPVLGALSVPEHTTAPGLAPSPGMRPLGRSCGGRTGRAHARSPTRTRKGARRAPAPATTPATLRTSRRPVLVSTILRGTRRCAQHTRAPPQHARFPPCASSHHRRRNPQLTRACTRPPAVCREQLVQPVRAERAQGDVELRHGQPLRHHDDARRHEMHDPVPHRPDALDQPLRGRAAPRPDHAQLATQPRWPLRAARPRQVALPPLGAEPPPDALRHRGALPAQVTPTRPHRTPQPTQARHRSVRWEGQLYGIAPSRRPSTVGWGPR